MATRSARSVSNVLRAAGIPTGYRYTQFGYTNHAHEPVTEPGVMVSRQHKARYGGVEDLGHVAVYPIDPAANGAETEAFKALRDRVVRALVEADLPLGKVTSLSVTVLDDDF